MNRFRGMTSVQQFTLLWSIVTLGLLYLGAAIGVIHLIREQRWMQLVFVSIVILYLVGLSVGGESTYRFRAPITPLLAILAGVGYGMTICKRANLPGWLGTVGCTEVSK
jgi:hypothetical protein